MLDFRTPTLEDMERIDSFVRECGRIGCDITSVNTFLWRKHYDIKIAFDDEAYYKSYSLNGKITGYAPPVTKGNIKTAVDKIIADAKERSVEPVIGLLSDSCAEQLHRLYEGRIRISEDRDSFDYIYEREKLAALSGKKYHAKRNHISRFKRLYDNYSVEELCTGNFSDALYIAQRWQNEENTGELDIIREAIESFETLGMFGLVLYVENRPVAMCMASEINSCVCDVNFEKAIEINEAYAVINNEFAKHYTKYKLVNREEDMGLEGLRKSKLSYHPAILLKKSLAVFE